MSIDQRLNQLQGWLKDILQTTEFHFEAASSDASFRRYFRVFVGDKTYIAMDAPPNQEDCRPFVEIAQLLIEHSLQAPRIHFQDLQLGFLLLDDLGSKDYLNVLNTVSADRLYFDAMSVIDKLHSIKMNNLAVYDRSLLVREMELFLSWFLHELLGVDLAAQDNEALSNCQSTLVGSALQQPQVFVHRDFHSRNLMLTEQNNPAVIDFQDAVMGPITYDLVSLLRDCYISWPDERVYAWLDGFLVRRNERLGQPEFSQQQFYQWFDYMGVQRHMKAVGIFARLLIRDGKSGYLKDIPRTLAYIEAVANKYLQLRPLIDILDKYQVNERLRDVLNAHSIK